MNEAKTSSYQKIFTVYITNRGIDLEYIKNTNEEKGKELNRKVGKDINRQV